MIKYIASLIALLVSGTVFANITVNLSGLPFGRGVTNQNVILTCSPGNANPTVTLSGKTATATNVNCDSSFQYNITYNVGTYLYSYSCNYYLNSKIDPSTTTLNLTFSDPACSGGMLTKKKR